MPITSSSDGGVQNNLARSVFSIANVTCESISTFPGNQSVDYIRANKFSKSVLNFPQRAVRFIPVFSSNYWEVNICVFNKALIKISVLAYHIYYNTAAIHGCQAFGGRTFSTIFFIG